MPNLRPPPELLTVAETDEATGNVVIFCRGRLVAGLTDEFYQSVRKFIPGTKRIVLDFGELTNMDSSGLGTVVHQYVLAKSAGCEVVLVNPGHGIRKILSMTKLLSFFTVIGENDIRPL